MKSKFICVVGKKRSGKTEFAKRFTYGQHNLKRNYSEPFWCKDYALADPIKDTLQEAYETLNLNKSSGVTIKRMFWDGKKDYSTDYDRNSPIMLSNRNVHELIMKAISLIMQHRISPQVKNDHSGKPVSKINYDRIAGMIMSNDKPWTIRRLMQTFGTDVVVNMIDKEYWNRRMFDEYLKTESKYFLVSDIRQKHEIDLMRALGAVVVHTIRDDTGEPEDDHITEKGIEPLKGEFIFENNGTLEEFLIKIEKFATDLNKQEPQK